MEIIAIAGYITDEKMHIARDYLEKNTRQACGIKTDQVSWTVFFLSFNIMCIRIEHLFQKQLWNVLWTLLFFNVCMHKPPDQPWSVPTDHSFSSTWSVPIGQCTCFLFLVPRYYGKIGLNRSTVHIYRLKWQILLFLLSLKTVHHCNWGIW
jgi:hypothetical protein